MVQKYQLLLDMCKLGNYHIALNTFEGTFLSLIIGFFFCIEQANALLIINKFSKYTH